jgi:hypothetical protein
LHSTERKTFVKITFTPRRRRVVAATAAVLLASGGLAVLTTSAAASPARDTSAKAVAKAVAEKDQYTFTRLAKAKPDECYNGIGQPYPVGPPCATGKPKVNQAYVWGLTQVGTMIWFGTGANVHCLVSGATLQYVNPTANDNWVCEFGSSQTIKADSTIPPYLGDMRPPEVWTYDTVTKASVNMSAQIRAKSPDDAARLDHTVGLRAAGNFGNVVLLGGPAIGNTLNMFAFDATTKQFLGSKTFAEYGNIRTFLVADNALYLGIGIGRNGSAGGGVLRWTGSVASPFDFVNIAALPVQAADLTVSDGRIVATSWPLAQATNSLGLAGLWMSPKLADGAPGLNPEDANGWKQVWNVGQYEPDSVIAGTYGGGGVAAADGYVYWGTMHVPMKAAQVMATKYPPADDKARQSQLLNSNRALSIWRARDLGLPTQKIEMLYGETSLPAYDPATSTWSKKSTNYTPVYGKSGFGNVFNNYTWRMAVVDGKVFVGTMDWSYLVKDLMAMGNPAPANSKSAKPGTAGSSKAKQAKQAKQVDGFGGDLWVFPSSGKPAQPVNTKGLGNYLNYGVRNMIVNGKGGLYLGMANPMNLRTDPTDNRPEGGWELLEMTKTGR